MAKIPTDFRLKKNSHCYNSLSFQATSAKLGTVLQDLFPRTGRTPGIPVADDEISQKLPFTYTEDWERSEPGSNCQNSQNPREHTARSLKVSASGLAPKVLGRRLAPKVLERRLADGSRSQADIKVCRHERDLSRYVFVIPNTVVYPLVSITVLLAMMKILN